MARSALLLPLGGSGGRAAGSEQEAFARWRSRMFCGEYAHPLDQKHRVVLPARLREVLSADDCRLGLYLTRGFDGSLLLFTKEEWDARAAAVGALPSNHAEARMFQRLFFSKAVRLDLDRQGRILIPESHRDMVGIKGHVVFVGVGKHIEVWPREKYEAYEAEVAGSYEELAEKMLLGGVEAGGEASSAN